MDSVHFEMFQEFNEQKLINISWFAAKDSRILRIKFLFYVMDMPVWTFENEERGKSWLQAFAHGIMVVKVPLSPTPIVWTVRVPLAAKTRFEELATELRPVSSQL